MMMVAIGPLDKSSTAQPASQPACRHLAIGHNMASRLILALTGCELDCAVGGVNANPGAVFCFRPNH